mmetsp:Transcript_14805/g.43198  ORF Transcript_14805/g.43198 Transcript_14805/m.43198 type:complete len:248 (+) Transcript_14805:1200-1943(+)
MLLEGLRVLLESSSLGMLLEGSLLEGGLLMLLEGGLRMLLEVGLRLLQEASGGLLLEGALRIHLERGLLSGSMRAAPLLRREAGRRRRPGAGAYVPRSVQRVDPLGRVRVAKGVELEGPLHGPNDKAAALVALALLGCLRSRWQSLCAMNLSEADRVRQLFVALRVAVIKNLGVKVDGEVPCGRGRKPLGLGVVVLHLLQPSAVGAAPQCPGVLAGQLLLAQHHGPKPYGGRRCELPACTKGCAGQG